MSLGERSTSHVNSERILLDIPEMSLTLFAVLVILGMWLGLLLFLEIGWRIGGVCLNRNPQWTNSGVAGTFVFSLLGLLLAFTFTGAGERFDARRKLAVEEVNNIGTAWLRLDLIPAKDQPALRGLFRQYVETRLAVARKLPDVQAAKEEWAKGDALQKVIWTRAVAACRDSDSNTASMLLLPALNQMIDITTTRLMAAQMHPPLPVYFMLLLLALGSALLAGYDTAAAKSRNWFLITIFTGLLSVSLYIIADFELPRVGFIHIHDTDHLMVDLLQSMK